MSKPQTSTITLGVIIMKTCSKCNQSKDLSEFYKDKSTKDGYAYGCITCRKKFLAKNRDKQKIKDAQYYLDNKEHIIKRTTMWRKNNIDKSRGYYNKAYKIHAEKRRADRIEYGKNNKEKEAAYSKWYRATERGRLNGLNACMKRRTHMKQGDVTTVELKSILASESCYWCGCSLLPNEIHVDHYQPLSKYGKHTISNLVASCQHCNQIKSTKDPISFANSISKLF